MEAIHRSEDHELCGYVSSAGDRWQATTVFGAVLSEHDAHDAAVAAVLDEGLPSLADRWTLCRPDGSSQIVRVVEAFAGSVILALDLVAMPSVPTMTLTAAQLASGEWQLTR